MNRSSLAAAAVLAFAAAAVGEAAVSLAAKLIVQRDGKEKVIRYAVSEPTDVEVAILGADGRMVRHLAAGVLGGKKPPPAPLKAGLSQSLEWDGKDDYGEEAKGGPFRVRVRAGMGVKLEKIVGGDPYAFWSALGGQGDHALWRVTGLEAKSDGAVYLVGNVTAYGGAVIRRYTAAGDYRRTLFPPAADKPVEEVKGWGVLVRSDGTFTLKSNDLWASPALSETILCGHSGSLATLIPSPLTSTLTLLDGRRFSTRRVHMTLATDGTLREYRTLPFVSEPAMPEKGDGLLDGPLFAALSPDGRSLYVSGLYHTKDQRGKPLRTDSFWRDGRVWKVDLATRKATVFFQLDEKDVLTDLNARAASPIGHTAPNPYAAFQGVAVDAEGNVFVGDRQNERIAVVDRDGKLVREIPVKNPDAVAVAPKSKALYVTTRFGNYSGNGKLHLLKFNDWTKDNSPSVTRLLREDIGKFGEPSLLAVSEDKGDPMVWAAYTTLPARVYRDTGETLELVKDFYEAGPQRALDLQHMTVDPKTGDVYIADNHGFCFRITDWSDPKFTLCRESADKRLEAASIAIDDRSRLLYAHHRHQNGVKRYQMDGEYFTPAPVGDFGYQVTPRIVCAWIFGGNGERGMAVAPDGGLATLGVLPEPGNPHRRADNYSGPLTFFRPGQQKAPWDGIRLDNLEMSPRTGGVRFDPRGNLYVGVYDGTVHNISAGFEEDPNFKGTIGRIYKYAPTGSIGEGDLFPKAPGEPVKIYDVHCGPFSKAGSRTPRFGVDPYGRIYYPNGLLPRVSVIDNAGNAILAFGVYGNRDSMGGLDGDLVPTAGVPMAWPNSVDATDELIYVSDIVNARLLRLAKTFAATATAEID